MMTMMMMMMFLVGGQRSVTYVQVRWRALTCGDVRGKALCGVDGRAADDPTRTARAADDLPAASTD